jgi:hypothetical protein
MPMPETANAAPRPRGEAAYVRARDGRGKMRLFAALVVERGAGFVRVRLGVQHMTLRPDEVHPCRRRAQEAHPALRFAGVGEEGAP